MSITDIYRQLLDECQIVPIPLAPMTPPYRRWYDLNASCKYHASIIDQSTENCITLKAKITMLIEYGWLMLGREDQSLNVNVNPLPNHGGEGSTGVNIAEAREKQTIADIGKVGILM